MPAFATLYSGSSGNSTLIRTQDTALLVDMGGSCKRTLDALYSLGCAARDIRGILVTHEHSDHVAGLYIFLKNYPVPVYGSARTLDYLRRRSLVPAGAALVPVEAHEGFAVGDIGAEGFRTSHDSEDCFGYRFSFGNGASMAVATDLGCVTDDVYGSLCGCELVALESNYEDEMLIGGRYPYYLKARIRSRSGHLSNAECAACAARLAQTGTRRLVLMHLSRDNNTPDVALTDCLSALENYGVPEDSFRVSVAPRFDVGELIEL
ncbi:MAG: MBL fold metallo-hydrolase [Oscillospiraceae bacterium]|nr:MBL fold metallo-hydrolase [Oscillospiraceae bacterium]